MICPKCHDPHCHNPTHLFSDEEAAELTEWAHNLLQDKYACHSLMYEALDWLAQVGDLTDDEQKLWDRFLEDYDSDFVPPMGNQ